eukprot:357166-Chlamydomonas_euryale.AAC.1
MRPPKSSLSWASTHDTLLTSNTCSTKALSQRRPRWQRPSPGSMDKMPLLRDGSSRSKPTRRVHRARPLERRRSRQAGSCLLTGGAGADHHCRPLLL